MIEVCVTVIIKNRNYQTNVIVSKIRYGKKLDSWQKNKLRNNGIFKTLNEK